MRIQKTYTALGTFFSVLLLGFFFEIRPALSEVQIPAEIEAQAQEFESRFLAVLKEECSSENCVPVGCEVVNFRTIDEKQSSSLPGLDMSEEQSALPLQHKLSSIRCEFAYEPELPSEAVATLRQRVSAKVKQAGVSLILTGRKLSPSSPALKASLMTKGTDLPVGDGPGESAEAPTLWKALAPVLPTATLILLVTLGVISLIWAYRRLGKPKPIVAESNEKSPVDQIGTDKESGPSAFSIINQREQLKELLARDVAIAEKAFRPLVVKSNVEDLCRVLQHFGPEPLVAFAQDAEFRDLFVEVRKKYEESAPQESNSVVGAFLDRVERLVALAQLGGPETSVHEELGFLRDLAPDEFSVLASGPSGLSSEELLSIVSFLPSGLRAGLLQARGEVFVDAYLQHVLAHPRVSDSLVRGLARRLRDAYTQEHAEIKNVSRDQLPIVEQMLGTLRGEKRVRLMARLRNEQPVLYEKLMSETLLESAIVAIPENILNDLFLLLTPNEAAALLDSQPDREAILRKLKAPLAAAIRERMQRTGAASFGLNLEFSEAETEEALHARRKLSAAVRERSARGEIDLRRLNESVHA